MRKFINIMTIVSAVVSSILILCTSMTSYQFRYLGQMFYSYMPIQIGVAVTMFFLSVRFWLNEHGIKRLGYSALSLSIGIIMLFSIKFIR